MVGFTTAWVVNCTGPSGPFVRASTVLVAFTVVGVSKVRRCPVVRGCPVKVVGVVALGFGFGVIKA